MKKLFFAPLVWLLAISTYGQSVDGALKTLTASGTDTYTVTEPLPATYSPKERFLVRFTNANTGAATLNRNGLGAKNIYKADGTALASGDIQAGGTYLLTYNGTFYQVVGDGGGGGGAPLTFSNGITESGGAVKLGGDLTAGSTINLKSYYLVFNKDTYGGGGNYGLWGDWHGNTAGSFDGIMSNLQNTSLAGTRKAFSTSINTGAKSRNTGLGITIQGTPDTDAAYSQNGIDVYMSASAGLGGLNTGQTITMVGFSTTNTGLKLNVSGGSTNYAMDVTAGSVRIPNQLLLLKNPSSSFNYTFATSAIAADRTVTLPLLTGNDTFVFQNFIQTLTNKTFALGSNTFSGTTAQFNTALSDNDFATLAGSESLTNKTLGSGTFWSSAPSITDGLTITFNPNGTQAGFNFGSHASNPSVGNPGDGFYNSTNNEIMFNDGNWRVAVLKDQAQTLTNKTIDPTANTIRYPVRTEAASGTYTLVAADENKTIEFSTASPITVTLPNGLSTSFGCTLVNAGGGTITLSATGTLQSTATTIPTQYTGAYVQHKGSNVWIAQGALGTPSGGSGDVVGPASATDNAVARFDAGTGKLIQNSGFVIDDDNNVTIGTGTAGSARIFYAAGSASDIDLTFNPKGAGVFNTGKVQTLWTDANTNNALETVRHERQSTGTVAAGFGIIHEYRLENAAGAVGAASKWTYTYSDPTNAAEVSTATLTTKNAGSDFNMIRVDGNKFGIFNATPVVKQSAVTTPQGIADALTAYGLLPSSTVSSGATFQQSLRTKFVSPF